MKGKYSRSEKSSWARKLLIALCIILSVVLVIMVGVVILAEDILGGINRVENDTQPTLNSEELNEYVDPTDTVPVQDQATSIISGKNVINILLVGQDRREGQARMHSDAMILCTVNTTTKTLTMTSFMRDMWVYIPDHYNERINVPYMVGGFDLLNKTLDYNFGVTADYNVEIDFAGFMKAVDLVGGLDIELTAKEARYLNRRGNWDIEWNTDWQLVEGMNHLTGSQALAYSRIREIGDDFERTQRQRKVLTILIEKAKTLSPTELYDLIKNVTPMLTTDMTNSEILNLAVAMVPMLSDLNVVSQRIPMDGEYYFANKGGASVIALSDANMEANIALLTEAMKEKQENN